MGTFEEHVNMFKGFKFHNCSEESLKLCVSISEIKPDELEKISNNFLLGGYISLCRLMADCVANKNLPNTVELSKEISEILCRMHVEILRRMNRGDVFAGALFSKTVNG